MSGYSLVDNYLCCCTHNSFFLALYVLKAIRFFITVVARRKNKPKKYDLKCRIVLLICKKLIKIILLSSTLKKELALPMSKPVRNGFDSMSQIIKI